MRTTQKLLKLADFLEHKVKSRQFDLATWGTAGFLEKECGSAACAAGWATVCFQGSGLTLVDNYADHCDIVYRRGRKTFEGFEACMNFFEIDRELAEHLFDPDEYTRPGRMDVVRRLRAVAKCIAKRQVK